MKKINVYFSSELKDSVACRKFGELVSSRRKLKAIKKIDTKDGLGKIIHFGKYIYVYTKTKNESEIIYELFKIFNKSIYNKYFDDYVQKMVG